MWTLWIHLSSHTFLQCVYFAFLFLCELARKVESSISRNNLGMIALRAKMLWIVMQRRDFENPKDLAYQWSRLLVGRYVPPTSLNHSGFECVVI